MTEKVTIMTPLAKHLAYLGLAACTCQWRWKGFGVLYGVSLGKGWIRMADAPDCPEHRK